MADVDFASQLLQASNARVQKRFDEQAATNAKLRDALLAKINETDPYGNPVLDAQGVSDALDQVKKIHMNGIGDLINTAKDALGKVHGLISAPPQVRQKVHDHVMNVVSKLSEGQQGEAADTTPVTQAAGLTPPPTMTGGAGSAGGAGGAGAPPIPKTATTTPSEEAAAALPPPPTPTALVPAPPQTPATPAPATPATPATAQPPVAAAPRSPIADILSKGRTKMNPVELYQKEHDITFADAMALEKAKIESAEKIKQASIEGANAVATIRAEPANKAAQAKLAQVNANMRKMGYRFEVDPTTQEPTGEMEPIPLAELSEPEKAAIRLQGSRADLATAQASIGGYPSLLPAQTNSTQSTDASTGAVSTQSTRTKILPGQQPARTPFGVSTPPIGPYAPSSALPRPTSSIEQDPSPLRQAAMDWAYKGLRPVGGPRIEAQTQALLQKYGLSKSQPIPPEMQQKVQENFVARDSAIDIIENIKANADLFNSMMSAGKIALATNPSTGLLIISRGTGLTDREAALAADWQALAEHINLLRGPLGATGFRGPEAFDALQSQRGRLMADPRITLSLLNRTESNLKGLNAADKMVIGGSNAKRIGGLGPPPANGKRPLSSFELRH